MAETTEKKTTEKKTTEKTTRRSSKTTEKKTTETTETIEKKTTKRARTQLFSFSRAGSTSFEGDGHAALAQDGHEDLDTGDDCSDDQPISMSAAGLTCTDFCGFGKRRVDAGESERHHAVWSAERQMTARSLLEDLYFSENSDLYPVQAKQVSPHSSTHHVVYVRAPPCRPGQPVSRTRCYAAGISKYTMTWIGPSTPEKVQKDFEEIFGAEP